MDDTALSLVGVHEVELGDEPRHNKADHIINDSRADEHRAHSGLSKVYGFRS